MVCLPTKYLMPIRFEAQDFRRDTSIFSRSSETHHTQAITWLRTLHKNRLQKILQTLRCLNWCKKKHSAHKSSAQNNQACSSQKQLRQQRKLQKAASTGWWSWRCTWKVTSWERMNSSYWAVTSWHCKTFGFRISMDFTMTDDRRTRSQQVRAARQRSAVTSKAAGAEALLSTSQVAQPSPLQTWASPLVKGLCGNATLLHFASFIELSCCGSFSLGVHPLLSLHSSRTKSQLPRITPFIVPMYIIYDNVYIYIIINHIDYNYIGTFNSSHVEASTHGSSQAQDSANANTIEAQLQVRWEAKKQKNKTLKGYVVNFCNSGVRRVIRVQ